MHSDDVSYSLLFSWRWRERKLKEQSQEGRRGCSPKVIKQVIFVVLFPDKKKQRKQNRLSQNTTRNYKTGTIQGMF